MIDIGTCVEWQLSDLFPGLGSKQGKVVHRTGQWLAIKIPTESRHYCPYTYKREVDVCIVDAPGEALVKL